MTINYRAVRAPPVPTCLRVRVAHRRLPVVAGVVKGVLYAGVVQGVARAVGYSWQRVAGVMVGGEGRTLQHDNVRIAASLTKTRH